MTTLEDTIEKLRKAVTAGTAGHRSDVSAALDAAVLTNPEIVTVPGEHRIDHVSASPAEQVTLDELEAILGSARRLPRRPSGGTRTVLFTGTMPGAGESGATVRRDRRAGWRPPDHRPRGRVLRVRISTRRAMG